MDEVVTAEQVEGGELEDMVQLLVKQIIKVWHSMARHTTTALLQHQPVAQQRQQVAAAT